MEAGFFGCSANIQLTLESVATVGTGLIRFNNTDKVTLPYYDTALSEQLEFVTSDINAWVWVSDATSTKEGGSKKFISKNSGSVVLNLKTPGNQTTLDIQVEGADGEIVRNYTIDAVYVCNPKNTKENMWDLASQKCTQCIENGDCSEPGSNSANIGPAAGYFLSPKAKTVEIVPCLVRSHCQGVETHCTASGDLFCEARAQVKCQEGFYGNLCQECDSESGRAGLTCVKCPTGTNFRFVFIVTVDASNIVGF
jgi:hypothetical protein